MESTPPVMDPSGTGGVAPRRYLVVVLEKGWRYHSDRRAFVHAAGQRFPVRGRLPRHTRISPMDTDLASRRVDGLSRDERYLARTVHVVPPASEALEPLLARVLQWACVAEGWVSADPALP